MSPAILGFIIGFILGTWFGMIMTAVIVACREEDDREARMFEEYLRRKRRFICLFSDLFGELPNCNGQCWECRFAYEQREEERPTMNEVREAFGLPPIDKDESEEINAKLRELGGWE